MPAAGQKDVVVIKVSSLIVALLPLLTLWITVVIVFGRSLEDSSA